MFSFKTCLYRCKIKLGRDLNPELVIALTKFVGVEVIAGYTVRFRGNVLETFLKFQMLPSYYGPLPGLFQMHSNSSCYHGPLLGPRVISNALINERKMQK